MDHRWLIFHCPSSPIPPGGCNTSGRSLPHASSTGCLTIIKNSIPRPMLVVPFVTRNGSNKQFAKTNRPPACYLQNCLGSHSTWGLRPRRTHLLGLEVGSQQLVGGQAPSLPGGCPQGGCTLSAPSQRGGCLSPYGQMRCSCMTDGGSPHYLPVASPPPPPHPACPPDFAATAAQGLSCTFAIRAGLLLTRGAHRGAASTGSCSASEGFGQRG